MTAVSAFLSVIKVLKMAVEVGLVVGMTAAMTPIGSAIFFVPTCLVFFDDAAGLGILICIVDIFRCDSYS